MSDGCCGLVLAVLQHCTHSYYSVKSDGVMRTSICMMHSLQPDALYFVLACLTVVGFCDAVSYIALDSPYVLQDVSIACKAASAAFAVLI